RRHPEQLGTEVVLEPRADHLLAVVQILRPDEPDDRIDQQRLKVARHPIRPGFERLLVDAMMGARGETRALPCFEVHHVLSHGPAAERERRVTRLAEQREVYPKAR